MHERKRDKITEEVGSRKVISPPPKRAVQLTKVQSETEEDVHSSSASISPANDDVEHPMNAVETIDIVPQLMKIAPPPYQFKNSSEVVWH